ncbi:MAG TPA: hypothetical protein VGF75_00905 [Candidatus Saccharimonadales bacterium]|jgi:hypothetical protein
MASARERKLKEAYDLLEYFYNLNDEDYPLLQAENFRMDVFRLIIIHFHLAIEELLKSIVYRSLPSRRTFTPKQNVEYVQKLSSRQTIDLAARLGIVNKKGLELLLELNTIRNKCSHHWILNGYTMSKSPSIAKSIKRKRLYKVTFQKKNLMNYQVMKDDFIPLYGDLYLELFAMNFGLRGKRKYTNK